MTNETGLELTNIGTDESSSFAISSPPSSSAIVEVSSSSTTASSSISERKENLIESFQELLKPVHPDFYHEFLEICAKKSLDEKYLSMLVFLLANTKCIPIETWNNQKELMQRVLDHIGGPINKDDPLREFTSYALSKRCKSENLDAMTDFKEPKQLNANDIVTHLFNFFAIRNSNFFISGYFDLALNFLDNFSKQKTVSPKLALYLLACMSAGNNFEHLDSPNSVPNPVIRKFLTFLDQQKENCPEQVLACLTKRSGMELGYRITSKKDIGCARQFLTLISNLNHILKNSQTELLQCVQYSGFPIFRKKEVTLNNQFLELLIFLKKGNLPNGTILGMLKSPDFYHSARMRPESAKDVFFPNLCAAVAAQDDVQFKINFFKFVKELGNPKELTHFIVPKMLMGISNEEGGSDQYEFNANTTFNQLILKKDWETLLFLFQNDFIGGNLLVDSSGCAFTIIYNSNVDISAGSEDDPFDTMNGFEWIRKYYPDSDKLLEKIRSDSALRALDDAEKPDKKLIAIEDGREGSRIKEDKETNKTAILLELEEVLDKCLNPSEFEDLLPRSAAQDLRSKKFSKFYDDSDDELDPSKSSPSTTMLPSKITSDAQGQLIGKLPDEKSTPVFAEPYYNMDYKKLSIMKGSSVEDVEIQSSISVFFKKLAKSFFAETRLSDALQLLDKLCEQKVNRKKIIELMYCMSRTFPLYTDIASSESSMPKFFHLLEELAKYDAINTLKILSKSDNITFSYVLASKNVAYAKQFFDFLLKVPHNNNYETIGKIIGSLRSCGLPIMAKSNTDNALKLKFIDTLITVTQQVTGSQQDVMNAIVRLMVEPFDSTQNLWMAIAQNNYLVKNRFLDLLHKFNSKGWTALILADLLLFTFESDRIKETNYKTSMFKELLKQGDGETLCLLMTKGLLEGELWVNDKGNHMLYEKIPKNFAPDIEQHEKKLIKIKNGYDWLKIYGDENIRKAKDVIYDYISKLSNRPKQYEFARDALDDKKPLGKFFALKSDRLFGRAPRKGVGTLGKLEKIYNSLREIYEKKPEALRTDSSSHSASSSSSVSSSWVMPKVETQKPQASSSRFLGSNSSSSSYSASSSTTTLSTLPLIKDSKHKKSSPEEGNDIRILSHIKSLEIGIKYHLHQRDKLIHLPSDCPDVSLILEGIKAHEQRIEALKKILKGDGITSFEHKLLLRIRQLKQDSYISEYANILPDKTAVNKPGVRVSSP